MRDSKSGERVDHSRRRVLGIAAGGVAASVSPAVLTTMGGVARASETRPLRWGFVGTGGIASSMARVVKMTPLAELVAVSSRRMEKAEAFRDQNDAQRAFDSWAGMAAWDGIDAVYVATPTSVREEISVAAAGAGKHVLAEKPFASLPSVRRITEACRSNNVVFMDGTHFVHHPRTASLQAAMAGSVGWPWSVASAFQFGLGDKGNIRFNPALEPMGAVGDAGWYNMRAAVEYLSPDASLTASMATLRRDQETGAAISGSGVMTFEDGSTSTWNCGFDSGAVVMDVRITGASGVVSIDNFLSQDADDSASYTLKQGGWGSGRSESVRIESSLPGAALMFADFAAAVADPTLREANMRQSERTQALLDAAWAAAIAAEDA